MAYLADFSTKSNATKATTLVFAAADFPAHVADEYLVIGATCEAEVAVAITASAGWTQIGSTVGNPATATGLYSAMFYKKCAGAAETCTITLSVTNAIHCHAFLIRDADLTTFLDGVSAANVATASQFNSASITTTVADTLLLYYIGIDSTTATPTMCHTAPGAIHFLDSSDNGGAIIAAGSKVMAAGAAGWYVQRTSGATPTPPWNMSLSEMTNRFTVGIRNKSGGTVPPYIDDSATIGAKVMDGHWWLSATTRNNENFKATPLSVTSFNTHLGALTGAFDAGAAVADSHINPYSNAVSSTPAVSATALTGFEVQMPTSTVDMSAGWLVGSVIEATPKAANWGTGSINTGGLFVVVGSTLNYRAFQVLSRDNLVNTEGRAIFSVQINQTQTQSGQSVTPPTVSAINRLWVLNRGNLAQLAQYHCDYHIINKITVAGGTNAAPVDSEGMYQIGKFLRLKLIGKQGAGGLLPLVPVQIGGGDAVNFQIDAGALQFPRIYNRAKREINYHGADNAIGISYAGKSGDVIKHTNSVVTSASPYYWEINAAATNAAVWDFNGLVVVGANVTLRNVMTFDGMAFSACPTLNFTECAVTNGSIKGVPATNDTLTTNAVTSISGCAINVTGVTAGNRWCSVANPSIFTSCIFTGSGTAGHAIRITTPGVYSLSGNVFNGFGADSSNFAAIYNDSGGAVTLNIAGGGSTPTVRNGAGATTTVVATATVNIGSLATGTRVKASKVSDGSVLFNGTETAGAVSFTTSYAGDVSIDARKGSAAPYYLPWVTQITTVIGQTNTVTALQQLDQ